MRVRVRVSVQVRAVKVILAMRGMRTEIIAMPGFKCWCIALT